MSHSIWVCSKWILLFSTSKIFQFWNKVCEKRGKCLSHCVLPFLMLHFARTLFNDAAASSLIPILEMLQIWNSPNVLLFMNFSLFVFVLILYLIFNIPYACNFLYLCTVHLFLFDLWRAWINWQYNGLTLCYLLTC